MGTNNRPTVIKSWIRLLLVIAGTVSVGLGILGIFLPVLPTTPFLLLAAACYARSSQKLYSWLLYNKWFGKYIRNYIQKKGIPLTIKVWTIGVLWLAIGTSAIFAVESLVIRVVLVVIAVCVTAHLLLVPTYKE
ncbi:MAG TPA: YbaN family protein [Dehalococcoidales bacterium]